MRLVIVAFMILALGLLACQNDEGNLATPTAEKGEIPAIPIESGDAYIQHMDLAAQGKIGIQFKGDWDPETVVNEIYMADGVAMANIPFEYAGVDKDVAYYNYEYSIGVDLKAAAPLTSELQVARQAVAAIWCWPFDYAANMEAAYGNALSSDYQLVSIDGWSEGTSIFSKPLFDIHTSDVYVELYEDGDFVKSERAEVLDSRTLHMTVSDFYPFLKAGEAERTKMIVDKGATVYRAKGVRAASRLQ